MYRRQGYGESLVQIGQLTIKYVPGKLLQVIRNSRCSRREPPACSGLSGSNRLLQRTPNSLVRRFPDFDLLNLEKCVAASSPARGSKSVPLRPSNYVCGHLIGFWGFEYQLSAGKYNNATISAAFLYGFFE